MKTASYFTADLEKPLKGVIIEEGKNADGLTVTMAKTADDKPFIVGAPVSFEPSLGYAVIDSELQSEKAKADEEAAAAAKAKGGKNK